MARAGIVGCCKQLLQYLLVNNETSTATSNRKSCQLLQALRVLCLVLASQPVQQARCRELSLEVATVSAGKTQLCVSESNF